VTRPGLAPMASALAVELLISILHHPLRQRAAVSDNSMLGAIPHQIRAFMNEFSFRSVVGHAFDKCTACSLLVLKAYLKGGVDFIIQVLNRPSILEDISGLSQLKKETEAISVDWDGDDNDDPTLI